VTRLLDLPIPELSIVFFVLTFGVGYVVLIWAYSNAKRLHDWYDLDTFDKTLQTFVVGGVITCISLFGLNAPWSSLTNTVISTAVWWDWFWKNIGALLVVESLLVCVVQTLIQEYLSRLLKKATKYSL